MAGNVAGAASRGVGARSPYDDASSRTAAHVPGVPVCKIDNDDFHRSTPNRLFGFFPRPYAGPSQFHRVTPEDAGEALRRDPVAFWADQVSAIGREAPAGPGCRNVGADFHDLRGVGIQAALHAIGLHGVDREPRNFHASHQRTSWAHQPQSPGMRFDIIGIMRNG